MIHFSSLDTIVTKLQSSITNLITTRDDDVQRTSLRILFKLLKTLTLDQINFVFPSLPSLSNHPNTEVRQLYYEILIWIYQNVCLIKTENLDVPEWKAKLLECLLRGLSDEDPAIANQNFNFWDEYLEKDMAGRFQQLLGRELYHPSVESRWVHYTSRLLISLSLKSVAANEKTLFKPLAEADFKEYTIDTSYRSLPNSQFDQSQAIVQSTPPETLS